jgi:PKD repeat protein
LTVQSVISSSPGTITRTATSNREIFELSELAADQSGLITLTAVLSSNLPTMIVTNNATIGSSATDSNSANNDAAADLIIDNAAPTLAAVGDQTITETVELALTMIANDLNGDNLTFDLTEAPAGAAINSDSGLFTWTPTESDGPGLFTITVEVSDSYGLTDSQSFEVTVNETESAPVFSFVDTHTIPEAEPFALTLTAADADVPEQALSVNLLDMPGGAVFSNTTGLFTWTPTELQSGSSYTMTALVTDTTGLTGSQHLVITVAKENSAPTLATITATQIITELTPLSFTATATDTDLPAQALTFTLQTLPYLNAPTGAAIDSGTGLFTWTPTESQGPGFYYVVVAVSDEEGESDSQLVMFIVAEDNTAPVLDPLTSTYTIDECETLTFTITAVDSDLQDLHFILAGAPDGVILDIDSGLFSWTPTEAQGPGVYTLTIIVSDEELTDSQTITITVNEVNDPPQFTSSPPISATAAVTYSYAITATDEGEMVSSGELTITLTTGPDWLSLTDYGDGTALLSGAPGSGDAGDHQVELQVSDGVLTETQTFTVTVEGTTGSYDIFLPIVVKDD